MVANLPSGEISLVILFSYDPTSSITPQDRMRLSLGVKHDKGLSPAFVDQLVSQGPLAEFYELKKGASPLENWQVFHAATEIIRLEEGIKASSPPGLDIHKLNELIPNIYYCIHPFKPRENNDFLMFDKTCSSLRQPGLLEILVEPTSQVDELDLQYREIVKLMAINSYSKDDYIIDSAQFDPFKDFYEPKTSGERESRVKDPIAEEFLRTHQKFHRVLRQPQLLFSIKAWAPRQETAHLLASTVAECAFEEGTYRLVDYDEKSKWFVGSQDASKELRPFLDACNPDIWDAYEQKGLFRLAHMTSVDEFKGMFRLPVAGYSRPLCLWKSTDYHRGTETADGFLMGYALGGAGERDSDEISPGPLNRYLDISSRVDVPVNMPVNLLTKHMFVAGVPGSGKTTAIFNLLIQLFKRGIPFLVIEPGKSEYRQLKVLQDHPDPTVQGLAKELRIYTPGKDEVSPFRFNPFQHPKGINVDEHIGQLLTCFEASMPLSGPLQALLSESVEVVYHKRMKQNFRDKVESEFPTMTELADTARNVMEKKGYAGDVRDNLMAALEVRLLSLTRLSIGKIFQCHRGLPSIKNLLKYPTVIEIQNLNAYQACLLILFLLSAIWEEIRIARGYSEDLRHVTVIEEAHNIVGRTSEARPSEDVANPKAYAAEYIVRMLAEIRALGEGIVIADQLPSAVASSVVKNTGTKLAHRLVSLVDRNDLGGAMLLQGPQMAEIARLKTGQAFYYTEGLYAPRQIAGLNAHEFLGLQGKNPPDNYELSSVIKEEDWFAQLKKGRYAYKVALLAEHYEKIVQCTNKAAGHLEIYREDFSQIKEAANVAKGRESLISLRSCVIKTRESLKATSSLLIDLLNSLPEDIRDNLDDSDLKKYKKLARDSLLQIKHKAANLDNSLEKMRAEIKDML